jgi:hypothetical protein
MINNILICLSKTAIVDTIIRYLFAIDSKSRWFLLHSIGNIWCISSCYKEILTGFIHPEKLYITPTTFEGYHITIALHAYHCIAYKLSKDDIFHHVVFIIFGAVYTILTQPYIASSLPLLTLNGIPGAIDYALLFMVKQRIIEKSTEKYANAILNSWFRNPVTLFIVGMGYCGILQNSRWECIPCLLIAVFNAIYFSNQAIINYTKYTM